jgi:hypothetical protein
MNTPTDEKTGAMIYNGQPLIMEPYIGATTPKDIATELMQEDAKSNPELAQFMKDMKGVLNEDSALNQYAQLYLKYMDESPVSEILSLAESLGVKITEFSVLKPYASEGYGKLKRKINEFAEKDKKGQLSAQAKREYYALKANINVLDQKINNAYRKKIESQAEKMQDKKKNYLNDPKNTPNIIDFVQKRDKLTKYEKLTSQAYEWGLAKAA